MTVETIRSWLTSLHENLCEEGKRVGRPDNIVAAVDATITAVKQAAEISGILDARIIRGTTADAPVTVLEPAAWEAATRTAYEKHHGPETTLAPPITWDELSEREQEAWRDSTRAALEVARIEVVNVVVEMKHEKGHVEYTAHEEDVAYSYIRLAPGDRVFVKRGTETNKEN